MISQMSKPIFWKKKLCMSLLSADLARVVKANNGCISSQITNRCLPYAS